MAQVGIQIQLLDLFCNYRKEPEGDSSQCASHSFGVAGSAAFLPSVTSFCLYSSFPSAPRSFVWPTRGINALFRLVLFSVIGNPKRNTDHSPSQRTVSAPDPSGLLSRLVVECLDFFLRLKRVDWSGKLAFSVDQGRCGDVSTHLMIQGTKGTEARSVCFLWGWYDCFLLLGGPLEQSAATRVVCGTLFCMTIG